MREIDVVFTEACVSNIEAGRKTLARRVVKSGEDVNPFGKPGDRLLVRASKDDLSHQVIVEVREVRCERLADIPDGDIVGEGIDISGQPQREAFALWWDSLHPRDGQRWRDNPEVWVVRFEWIRSR